ncbi:hypothetical protein B9Z55_028841 [Caenorhabditis nigoni]|uniref:Uncharacterized protein n=1 Tax=Caenorhabditis nigoni TaxID=1611254 RepID=A0A2G5SA67_9PELO|nr:hypothetical protein B9Z55_028841 [Caenorhabditis nigoni]
MKMSSQKQRPLAGALRLDWNNDAPPPPPAPIAEAQEASQLDPSDDEVDEAIQELGLGSWPRPDATEKQMKEAGQAKREVAAHKKRALELKRQRKERKMEKKRLMEQNERAQEEQLKVEKEEEEEEEQKFAAMMQRRRNELQEKQFLFRRFLMEELGNLQVRDAWDKRIFE